MGQACRDLLLMENAERIVAEMGLRTRREIDVPLAASAWQSPF